MSVDDVIMYNSERVWGDVDNVYNGERICEDGRWKQGTDFTQDNNVENWFIDTFPYITDDTKLESLLALYNVYISFSLAPTANWLLSFPMSVIIIIMMMMMTSLTPILPNIHDNNDLSLS